MDHMKSGLDELLGKLYKYLGDLYGDQKPEDQGMQDEQEMPQDMMDEEKQPGVEAGSGMFDKNDLQQPTAPKEMPTHSELTDEEKQSFMKSSKYSPKPGPGTSIMVALGAPGMSRKPQRRRAR